MTLLTVFIIWIIALLLIVVLNARYWTIMPDLESREEKDARTRNITNLMPNTPIPMKHKVSYVIDWAILITIIVVLLYFIF